MARKELIEQIKRYLEQGVDREQLVSDLIFAGFNYQEIQGALNEMASSGQLAPEFFSEVSKKARVIPKGQHIESIAKASAENGDEQITVKEIIAKYKTRFFIFIGALIFITAGIYLGFYLYGNNSSVVIGKAMTNLAEAHSFGYFLTANIEVDRQTNDFVVNNILGDKATLESRGVIDLSAADFVRFSSQILARQGFNSTSSPLFDFGIISTAPSDLYLNINYLATTTPEQKIFYNQLALGWVKVDAPLSDLNGLIPENILSDIPDYQKLTVSALASIVQSAKDSKLIQSIVNIGNETINQAQYYHYRINFNQADTIRIAGSFYSALGKSGGALTSLLQAPWDIWISKTDSTIYRVEISLPGAVSGYVFGIKDIDVYLSGFNSVIPVAPPQQFDSLSHVIEITKQ